MKDMAERAGWTAVEAFLAVWVVGDVASLKAAGIAAAAAGLTVIKTYAKSKVAA